MYCVFADSELERSREIELTKVVIIIIFMRTRHLNTCIYTEFMLYLFSGE